MRVLLDECVPKDLARELQGHSVRTVGQAGWSGKRNGELLRLASDRFDVLVTVDAALHRQRPSATTLGIVVVRARSNRIEDLQPLMEEIRAAIAASAPGKVIVVEV